MAIGPAPRQQQRTLLSIQYLRGVAALLVVFHHARNPQPWLYNPVEWFDAAARGVDIFFVISGFIMLTAASGEPILDFYRRRMIRVVPLYWIATGALVLELKFHVVIGDLLKSLFFVPFYDRTAKMNIYPILVPGWTLNYEMFFYLVFGLGLLSRRVVVFSSAVILTLVVLGVTISFHDAIFETLTNPQMLEFLAGIYVAALFRRYSFRRLKLLLPIGFVALLTSDHLAIAPMVRVGIPAVMIVAGALAFEEGGGVPRWRPAKLLGDASYSLYLSHSLLFVYAYAVILKLHLAGPVQFGALILLVMAASIVCGIVVHKVIEKPLTRWLSGLAMRTDRPSPRVV